MNRHDPHYWLGYLSMSIAHAVQLPKPAPPLKKSLSAFLSSPAATAELREIVRREMKNGA